MYKVCFKGWIYLERAWAPRSYFIISIVFVLYDNRMFLHLCALCSVVLFYVSVH